MELIVLVIVLMPSIISGEACALHVCWIVDRSLGVEGCEGRDLLNLWLFPFD